jgi:hypothetical protein
VPWPCPTDCARWKEESKHHLCSCHKTGTQSINICWTVAFRKIANHTKWNTCQCLRGGDPRDQRFVLQSFVCMFTYKVKHPQRHSILALRKWQWQCWWWIRLGNWVKSNIMSERHIKLVENFSHKHLFSVLSSLSFWLLIVPLTFNHSDIWEAKRHWKT